VLLRLEDSLQKSRLVLAEREHEATRSERRRACLEAERAAREFERTRKLASEDIVSEDLLDEIDSMRQGAAAACEAATANVSRAEASVGLARTELEKTVLRAPFDGIVAEVSIEVGEWTTPSPPALPVPPVVDLIDPSSIYISAPMDEVDSARVAVDQRVRATIDSHRDRHFMGRVSRVAPYVLDLEAQNRTVEIEVELDAHDERFLPGTSADVEIILRIRDGVPRISTAAIMEGNKILVLNDGELVERELTPGLRNWDFTEVVAGLEEGELVVTSLDRAEVIAGARAEVSDDEEE
jgi:HlyD family secretion protein